jgi:GDP-mannose 6-dehydrogenase
MVYVAKEMDVTTPLLASVIPSNDAHIQRVVDTIVEMRKRRVTLVGLSFKVGSDDLRESPFVRLAEALIGKGVPLKIYDSDVAIGNVFGRNRAYVEEHLPHVGQLVGGEFPDVIHQADVVIVGKRLPEVASLPGLCRADQVLIDLVGIPELGNALRPWSSTAPPAAVGGRVGAAWQD